MQLHKQRPIQGVVTKYGNHENHKFIHTQGLTVDIIHQWKLLKTKELPFSDSHAYTTVSEQNAHELLDSMSIHTNYRCASLHNKR